MKIGIDARFWGLEHTGFGRYVMELIRNLETIDRKNQYVIFLRKKYFNKLKFAKNFTKVLAEYPHYSFSEQIFFKRELEKAALDLVHFPQFNLPILYRGPFVVTIHDLIKHESKGPLTTTRSPVLYWFKYLGYLLTVNFAIKKARKVIVPSRWWKKRLMKKYNLPSQKIVVTYESVGKEFKKTIGKLSDREKKRVLTKYKLEEPFIVYTGNLYPHKNVIRLVAAVKKINETQKLSLVIVCAKSVFWQRLKKAVDDLGASDLVILAGFVSDRELRAIYQNAEALVFPSLLEGFGLPGLEAMALGLPVVAARSSCLPEIYQEAAWYFHPRKVADIKAKILEVINDPVLKKKLIKAGYRQVNKFSWLKMAKQTLRIYQNACCTGL